jgi:hypothetical protein
MASPRLSALYKAQGNHVSRPHPKVVQEMVPHAPRLSSFYKAQGNHVPRPHPMVIKSANAFPKHSTDVREVFQYPEGPAEAMEWTLSRKSVPQGRPKYRQHYPSEENAPVWGNILSRHDTYNNAVNNIRGRNLSNASKLSLEESAAFMFEPNERRSEENLLAKTNRARRRKRNRTHRKHRVRGATRS